MSELKFVRLLFRGDWQRSRGDLTMQWLLLGPVVNIVLLGIALPRLVWFLENDLDLSVYLPVIVGFVFIWLAPLSVGLWSTLLFLEEKENGLKTIALLPISRSGFLAYRLWLPGLYSFFLVLLGLVVCSPQVQSYALLSGVSFVAALQTPLLTLLLFRFSSTRVQALQLSQLLRLIEFGVLFAFFWPAQWQNLAGLVFPPYWILKTYLIGGQGLNEAWSHLAMSLVFLLPLLFWAKHQFLKVYTQACR